jgi:hypothetical protein
MLWRTARPVSWRAQLRLVVACLGLLVALGVVCGITPAARLTRAEFFTVVAGVFLAWGPILLIRDRWAFRIGAVAFAALYQLVLLFGGFPWVLLASLPALTAALFRETPPSHGFTVRLLGTTLAVGLSSTLLFGLLVVPVHGPRLTVCFTRQPSADEESPIYSNRTDRGDEFLPGVTTVLGGTDMTIEFQPFAPDGEVETVERRAERNPLVTRVVRGDPPC